MYMNANELRSHHAYIKILREMTPEMRLRKAFELTEFSKTLFAHGLRKRFPNLGEEDFNNLLQKRLNKCHNRNY